MKTVLLRRIEALDALQAQGLQFDRMNGDSVRRALASGRGEHPE